MRNEPLTMLYCYRSTTNSDAGVSRTFSVYTLHHYRMVAGVVLELM